MSFEKQRVDYVLSLSYGKDSMACLGACEELGIKIDRVIHAEVWATDTIPAELPPMVEFKAKADRIIKERWGIEVEHFRADVTYEEQFYKKRTRGKSVGQIYGFPVIRGAWCNDRLKMAAIKKAEATSENAVSIVGIAADEPVRIERQRKKENVILPLVDLGWTEAKCREWCEENDLLSPTYTTEERGGCWFCHNQGVGALRRLRRDYPHYWRKLLAWEKDSPVSFRPDRHTVHDFDERFRLEDEGFIKKDEPFRWSMIEEGGINYRLF